MRTNSTFSMVDLYREAHDRNHLLSVMIELLTVCNLRCKHCYIPQHDNWGMTTEQILSLIKDLRKAGVLNVSLTGGEIFLRDDIFEIIEAIRKQHMRVFLLSNITTLDEEKIKKLAKLNVTEVSTSVYSLNSEIHDKITTVKGSLDKTLENLELLKKYGIKVLIKTPLMEDNRFAYKDIIKYCDKNQFEFLPGTIIFAKSDGNKETHSLRINEKDFEKVMRDLDILIPQRPFLEIYNEPCAALKYSIAIDCQGKVYPCNSLYYEVGDLKESNILDIWRNSKKLEYIKSIKKQDLEKCESCNLKKYCSRCPGLTFLEDKSLLGCSSIAKQNAIVKHKIYQKEGAV